MGGGVKLPPPPTVFISAYKTKRKCINPTTKQFNCFTILSQNYPFSIVELQFLFFASNFFVTLFSSVLRITYEKI